MCKPASKKNNLLSIIITGVSFNAIVIVNPYGSPPTLPQHQLEDSVFKKKTSIRINSEGRRGCRGVGVEHFSRV